jgi:adenosine deaminase
VQQLLIFEPAAPPADPLEAQLRGLPKIDLHAHLSGCLRLSTVEQLIRDGHLEVPKSAGRNLTGALVFQSRADSYAASFQPWSQILNKIMEIPDVVSRLLLELAEDFSRDGVVYSEVRVSPRVPLINGEIHRFLKVVDEAVTEARRQFPLDLRIILGFTRHSFYHLSPESQDHSVATILRAAEPYRGRTIVGFDLWGNEERHPPREFERIFRPIRDANYPLTIHAGEVYSASFIRDAIQILACQRLGHATAIVKDKALFELIRQHQILIEVCLTSNWVTGVVDNLSSHPLKAMIAEQLPVSLCTDNTLIYNTCLSREVAKALRLRLIRPFEVPGLFRAAAQHIFGPASLRPGLLDRVEMAYTPQILAQMVDTLTQEGSGGQEMV